MRQRFALLVIAMFIAVTAAACGRATEVQINQALGITPTPTLSADEIASATAAASATVEARLLAASSPGAGALGDVTRGQRQFDLWCINCHTPGGIGPDIVSAGSPGASVTDDALLTLVREGTGHAPGPYKVTELSDSQVLDIAAYLRSAPGG